MLWLEMSVDEAHGGNGWGFTQCLWSPSHKNPAGKSPYYEAVRSVGAGDSILHLRGATKDQACFTGFSVAETDGFETTDRPPQPAVWAYASSFYRVFLHEYSPFPDPVLLSSVFLNQDTLLRAYYHRNKASSSKKTLFYVIQHGPGLSGGRLQRSQGTYLTPVDDVLLEILLGVSYDGYARGSNPRVPGVTVATSQRTQELEARIGQQLFSNNVRDNFNSACCFPGCNVSDRPFLVGAHIARWNDEPLLRGDTTNGLCLCLMHDKAFEVGLFVVSSDLTVIVNSNKSHGNIWAQQNLVPHEGRPIKPSTYPPSIQALRLHWKRVSFAPVGYSP